jgi:hypothetical protein
VSFLFTYLVACNVQSIKFSWVSCVARSMAQYSSLLEARWINAILASSQPGLRRVQDTLTFNGVASTPRLDHSATKRKVTDV